MEAERLWQAALDELKLQMTADTFDYWLRGTRGLELADGTLRVGVPNVYAKDWLEHRLRRTIDRTLAYIRGELSVEFLVAPR
jgi:chromosomal replication initiation ATPase DnaA